jgi:putative serine protease PepD
VSGAAALAVLTTGIGAAIGVQVGEHRVSSSSTPVSASGGVTTAPVIASNGTTNIEAVAASVQPAVVSISERTAQLQGTGSGVVLDSAKGYILTNNHVVSAVAGGSGTLMVTTFDGRSASAKVIGRDPTSDIAVIQVSLPNLTAARLGDSGTVKVGETVVAFGSPLGLQGTVTSGIVSSLDRPVSTQDPNASGGTGTQATIDAIQTDAAINPGNSGGALVDGSGQVIGINSAIATTGGGNTTGTQSGSIGVGFAIPINEAKNVANQIINTGHAVHPVIDAAIGPTTDGSDGALVARVGQGGPAEKAGLQPGDVITAVGGKKVVDPDAAIVALRKDHKPGDKVSITIDRNGSSKTLSVTLGASAPSP